MILDMRDLQRVIGINFQSFSGSDDCKVIGEMDSMVVDQHMVSRTET
jgi:hypothetical protein